MDSFPRAQNAFPKSPATCGQLVFLPPQPTSPKNIAGVYGMGRFISMNALNLRVVKDDVSPSWNHNMALFFVYHHL